MIRIILAAGTLTVAALALGGCATMSEDQCMAGDWGGQGYRDGVAGADMGRLEDHAKACAKYGVTPDLAVYSSARADGLTRYCTVENGFRVGRLGESYRGVCPAELEAGFVPAFRDGEVVHRAESALEDALSAVRSRASRLEELDDKIDAKRRESSDESLPQDQRDRARDRVGELQREKEDTRREWRNAQRDADWAERELRDVRDHYGAIYGWW